MKINWKLRFTNKTTLTAIILAVIALIYQVLGFFQAVPAISQSEIVEISGMVINLLVLIGIVTDPTTSGMGDSKQALDYEVPKDN